MNKNKIKKNIRKEIERFSRFNNLCKTIAFELDSEMLLPQLWNHVDLNINSTTNKVELIKWDALEYTVPIIDSTNKPKDEDRKISISSMEKVQEAFEVWDDSDTEFTIIINDLQDMFFEPTCDVDVENITERCYNRFLQIYYDMNNRYNKYKQGKPWQTRIGRNY